MNQKIAADFSLDPIMNQKNSRRAYKAPQLIKLGDLRTVTLGSSVLNDCESDPGNGCVSYNRFGFTGPDIPKPGGFPTP